MRYRQTDFSFLGWSVMVTFLRLMGVRVRAQPRYCSSVTFSSHSTALPSFNSCIAMCDIAVVGVAPCPMFFSGGAGDDIAGTYFDLWLALASVRPNPP